MYENEHALKDEINHNLGVHKAENERLKHQLSDLEDQKQYQQNLIKGRDDLEYQLRDENMTLRNESKAYRELVNAMSVEMTGIKEVYKKQSREYTKAKNQIEKFEKIIYGSSTTKSSKQSKSCSGFGFKNSTIKRLNNKENMFSK